MRFDLAGTCCHQKGGEKSLLHEKNILIPQRDKEDMRKENLNLRCYSFLCM